MITGAAGALAVVLVIAVLVGREAFRPAGRAIAPTTVPLLALAAAILLARASAVLR